MFKRLPNPKRQQLIIHIEGREVLVSAGESVAAAVLASGLKHCRTTPVSGIPRAPFCMMGVCFECLMEIDGVPNQQACLVQVRDGMQIRRQSGARRIDP